MKRERDFNIDESLGNAGVLTHGIYVDPEPKSEQNELVRFDKKIMLSGKQRAIGSIYMGGE